MENDRGKPMNEAKLRIRCAGQIEDGQCVVFPEPDCVVVLEDGTERALPQVERVTWTWVPGDAPKATLDFVGAEVELDGFTPAGAKRLEAKERARIFAEVGVEDPRNVLAQWLSDAWRNRAKVVDDVIEKIAAGPGLHLDAVAQAMADAPPDSEPYTDEERARVAEARKSLSPEEAAQRNRLLDLLANEKSSWNEKSARELNAMSIDELRERIGDIERKRYSPEKARRRELPFTELELSSDPLLVRRRATIEELENVMPGRARWLLERDHDWMVVLRLQQVGADGVTVQWERALRYNSESTTTAERMLVGTFLHNAILKAAVERKWQPKDQPGTLLTVARDELVREIRNDR